MEKSYKFRIYPNKTQQNLIHKTFGCVRFVYNHFLARQMDIFKSGNKHLSYNQMCKELTSLKNELDWLKEPDKCSLQNSLKDLDRAYQNYFRNMKKLGYVRYSKDLLEHLKRINKKPTLYLSNSHPKFKKKKNHHNSYRTAYTNNNIEVNNGYIKLPKLGRVKYRDKQIIEGKILNATISQEPSGKYFCSICCTEVPIITKPKTNKNIGIDLGIKSFATLSIDDNNVIENPKYLKKSIAKLKKLQIALSRKQINSANWNKNRIKIARLQEHIANQRKDFLDKLTTNLITNYDIICIEDLQVRNMLKNHKLAQSISDVSWYEFVRRLNYKALWYGKTISNVDKFYPSSQLCHVCGYKNKRIKDLSVRKWECPECKTMHDRDHNAAINILNEGIRLLGIG